MVQVKLEPSAALTDCLFLRIVIQYVIFSSRKCRFRVGHNIGVFNEGVSVDFDSDRR